MMQVTVAIHSGAKLPCSTLGKPVSSCKVDAMMYSNQNLGHSWAQPWFSGHFEDSEIIPCASNY